MPTILERLRLETQQQHCEMEAVFVLPRSRREHVQWLERYLGFVEPLEAHMSARLGSGHAALAGRAKAPWLQEDLAESGLSAEQIKQVPRCADLPLLKDEPTALGACYVLEGATLGGQLIARHVEAELGLAGGKGYRYYRSYGTETARRWQQFRQVLLAASAPEADGEMVEGAREAFARLRSWCTATR